MDMTTIALAKAGAFAAVGLAAVGSALGTGAAGASAVGAWKKCYAKGKAAPFLLAAFVGAPLTQIFYGMIVMGGINDQIVKTPELAAYWPLFIIVGIFGGAAMGASAWLQGKAAAGACDAFAETGEGFVNYMMALGIIETVAIFAMLFGGQIADVATKVAV